MGHLDGTPHGTPFGGTPGPGPQEAQKNQYKEHTSRQNMLGGMYYG